jgi:hypothetical protein
MVPQYQIRFLGYKGVVSVDRQLEGIHLRLRPSMNKFQDHGEEYAMVEIARPVVKPNTPHLNRYDICIFVVSSVLFHFFPPNDVC